MIASQEEKRAALQSMIDFVSSPDFDITEVSMLRPGRTTEMGDGTVLVTDTGVCVVTISGIVPTVEDSVLPAVSESEATDGFVDIVDGDPDFPEVTVPLKLCDHCGGMVDFNPEYVGIPGGAWVHVGTGNLTRRFRMLPFIHPATYKNRSVGAN